MRSLATAAMAAIEDGTAQIAGAVEILAVDEAIRVWSGHGILPLEGEDYLPLGDRDLGIATGAALGGIAQNLSLSLSGIEPALLELLDAASIKGAPVRVITLVFDCSGTQLLDHFVHRRGRVDRVSQKETSAGTATITVEVEGPGRGLGRRTGRMRSDADQRLIDPDDGGMRQVSFAAEKTLYWGGRRPSRAGASLGGGGRSGMPGYEYGQQFPWVNRSHH